MIRRLRLRLTAVCAASTALVLVGMAVASFHFSTRQLQSQARESFSGSLNSILFQLRGGGVISHTWLAQTEADNGLWIHLDSGGTPLYYSSLDSAREEVIQLALRTAREEYGLAAPADLVGSGQVPVLFQLSTPDGSYYAAAALLAPERADREPNLVLFLRSRAQEQAQILQLGLLFSGCVSVAVLLLLFAWAFTGRAVKPVEKSRKQQTEFISAASHELRSPLAVMRASAETIKRSPAKSWDFADIIEGECVRLARLTEDLLRLASADSGSWSIHFSTADPETILLSVSERYEALAEEKRISLEVSLPQEELPQIRCDSQRVEQVLALLVDNAVAYTPEHGRIMLSIARERRYLCFSVADSGPGIPDAQKEKVFRRFYRGDSSRTSKEHYGLGLAVGQEIAKLHKGSLRVEDSPLGGAVFLLRLPLEHTR